MKKMFIILMLVCTSVLAKDYGTVSIKEVLSVYDGDTFFVNIPAWPSIAGSRIGIRINGIDTPEIKSKCYFEHAHALAAKAYLESRLNGMHSIELRDISRDKYFRIDAHLFVDGKDVGQEMIEKGLAVDYYGGKKIDWCRQNVAM